MSYILIMIVINVGLSVESISTQHIRFNSHNACLQAMQKLVDMEKGFKVKAICVPE